MFFLNIFKFLLADVTKKILEDIQIKKQLLQKGVSPVTPNISATPAGLTIPQVMRHYINRYQ